MEEREGEMEIRSEAVTRQDECSSSQNCLQIEREEQVFSTPPEAFSKRGRGALISVGSSDGRQLGGMLPL